MDEALFINRCTRTKAVNLEIERQNMWTKKQKLFFYSNIIFFLTSAIMSFIIRNIKLGIFCSALSFIIAFSFYMLQKSISQKSYYTLCTLQNTDKLETVLYFNDYYIEYLCVPTGVRTQFLYSQITDYTELNHVILLNAVKGNDLLSLIVSKKGFTKGTLPGFINFMNIKCPYLHIGLKSSKK